MDEIFKADLCVNNLSIELNPFIEEFLSRIVAGAVSSLRGVEAIQSLELSLDHGDVKVMVNGDELLVTAFPNEIIANTITGLVSSLKGVNKIQSLHIAVKAERERM